MAGKGYELLPPLCGSRTANTKKKYYIFKVKWKKYQKVAGDPSIPYVS